MRKYNSVLVILLIMGLLTVSSICCVAAQADSDNDGISDTKEQQLASTYAPVMHFADGEKFFPTDLNYHIQNSELYRKTENTDILTEASPTATSIAQYTTEDYYMKNKLGSGDEIAQDYQQKRQSIGDRIYAHVTRESGTIVVQYWFFYAYNPGSLNQHQGDWEMIEIVLNANETPQFATYAQHNSGQRAQWQD
ncbi:MAG: hypothetical protein CW691_02260, partial [Candidatus Bathyarchaeum sp.]